MFIPAIAEGGFSAAEYAFRQVTRVFWQLLWMFFDQEEKKMSITGGVMVPHPPIILPEIGRGEEKKIEDQGDVGCL